MFTRLYWFFSYLGAMTFSAAFIAGFRHAPEAPTANIVFNLIAYGIFIGVHIVMTMPAFKRTLFGNPAGTPFDRRIYVTISVMTWVGLYILHKPVGGFAYESPAWLQFVGLFGRNSNGKNHFAVRDVNIGYEVLRDDIALQIGALYTLQWSRTCSLETSTVIL